MVLLEIARCLLKTYVMKILLGVLVEKNLFYYFLTPILFKQKIIERCRQALQELTIFNNQNIQIHVCQLCISSSAFANDPYLVIRHRSRLYAVKASGRNQVRTFHQLPQIVH